MIAKHRSIQHGNRKKEASSECGILHAVAHLEYKMLQDRVCLIVHLITHAICQNGFHTVTKCLLIDLAVWIIIYFFSVKSQANTTSTGNVLLLGEAECPHCSPLQEN